jgi:hypothetical protein
MTNERSPQIFALLVAAGVLVGIIPATSQNIRVVFESKHDVVTP